MCIHCVFLTMSEYFEMIPFGNKIFKLNSIFKSSTYKKGKNCGVVFFRSSGLNSVFTHPCMRYKSILIIYSLFAFPTAIAC